MTAASGKPGAWPCRDHRTMAEVEGPGPSAPRGRHAKPPIIDRPSTPNTTKAFAPSRSEQPATPRAGSQLEAIVGFVLAHPEGVVGHDCAAVIGRPAAHAHALLAYARARGMVRSKRRGPGVPQLWFPP